MQRAEIHRKIGCLFDGVDLLVNVSHAAHIVPAGKDIGAAVAAASTLSLIASKSLQASEISYQRTQQAKLVYLKKAHKARII